MPVEMPKPQLSGAIVHERETAWPDDLRIVARHGKKTFTEVITKEMFFGQGGYGAPLTGDQLLGIINRLRKMKS